MKNELENLATHLERITACSRRSHGFTYDDEIKMLRSAAEESVWLKKRVGELRTALAECFAHLGKEIERKTLNESAKDGTQALSREIARLLDASAAPSNR